MKRDCLQKVAIFTQIISLFKGCAVNSKEKVTIDQIDASQTIQNKSRKICHRIIVDASTFNHHHEKARRETFAVSALLKWQQYAARIVGLGSSFASRVPIHSA